MFGQLSIFSARYRFFWLIIYFFRPDLEIFGQLSIFSATFISLIGYEIPEVTRNILLESGPIQNGMMGV